MNADLSHLQRPCEMNTSHNAVQDCGNTNTKAYVWMPEIYTGIRFYCDECVERSRKTPGGKQGSWLASVHVADEQHLDEYYASPAIQAM